MAHAKRIKNITTDELARIVNRGFEKTATQADLERFATKADLSNVTQALMNRMDGGFGSIENVLKLLREDVHHWKTDILNLQARQNNFEKRLDRVEKKVGLSK